MEIEVEGKTMEEAIAGRPKETRLQPGRSGDKNIE